MPATSIVMALGSLVAAGVLILLKLTPDVPDEQPVEKQGAVGAEFGNAVAHGR